MPPAGMTRAEWRRVCAEAAVAAAAAAASATDVNVSDDTATTVTSSPNRSTRARIESRVRSVRRPRRRVGRKVIARRVLATVFPATVIGVVGVLLVGTATPVGVVAGSAAPTPLATAAEIQAYVSGSDAEEASTLSRPSGYEVSSMAEVAASEGVTQFSNGWVNDESAPVQYPFPVGVPISAAFGSSEYLAQFGRVHNGTDFTPGAGAEVHAVASGTVRIATESGGDYGVSVVIDHVIDGQNVSTRYGHMQYGSLLVTQGQTVEAGDVIGLVGSTGLSTGAHLHLEVLLDGVTRIDPVAWLQEHAN